MKSLGRPMKCPRCGHEWNYKGTAWWITCPRCRKMIKNAEVQEGKIMDKQAFIERTQNWGVTKNPDGSTSHKLKINLGGSLDNLIGSLDKLDGSDDVDTFAMKESVRFFYLAREAWLNGDFETVADYFGVLV